MRGIEGIANIIKISHSIDRFPTRKGLVIRMERAKNRSQLLHKADSYLFVLLHQIDSSSSTVNRLLSIGFSPRMARENGT